MFLSIYVDSCAHAQSHTRTQPRTQRDAVTAQDVACDLSSAVRGRLHVTEQEGAKERQSKREQDGEGGGVSDK